MIKSMKIFETIEWVGNGYVINGYFFLGGFKETMFLTLKKEDFKKIKNILNKVSDTYKDDILLPLDYVWLHGPFAPKYNVWIPACSFQAPFKTLESAVSASEELIKEFDEFSIQMVNSKTPICIAIAEGKVGINKENALMSDGSAYHKSGRYIDNPNNCIKMINNNISIKVI